MAELRKRTAAKGWVSRSKKELEKLLEDKIINFDELTEAINDLDTKLCKFDEAQSNYELTLTSEEEITKDIDEIADFKHAIRALRIVASRKLSELSGSKNEQVSDSITSNPDVRLPKLTLPSFSGDVLNFQTFWDQFNACVDQTDLPNISKFTYLKSVLTGEARQSISGLSLTNDNYVAARDILVSRFGRPERIIFMHLQSLLSLSVPVKCNVAALWKFHDDLTGHIRSLETQNITGSQYGVILTPMVLSRMPQDLRMEWSRDGEGRENDLEYLLEFLSKEIKRRERSQSFKDSVGPGARADEVERRPRPSTASALVATSRCGICGASHNTEQCFKLTRVSLRERSDVIRSAGLCYSCLRAGHVARDCKASCSKCHGRHHKLVCRGGFVPPTTQSASSAKNVSPNSVTPKHVVSHTSVVAGAPVDNTCTRKKVLLQTARVMVDGVHGVTEATVLFDTGSDRSYITSDLVRNLKPEWVDSQPISFAAFGSSKPSNGMMCNLYNVILQNQNGTGCPLVVTEVPVICAPLSQPSVPQDMLDSLGQVTFDYSEEQMDIKVDILIGLDSYWKFVRPQVKCSEPEGLLAQFTVFGWIVFGVVPETCHAKTMVSHQLFCSSLADKQITSFWELESIGISSVECHDAKTSDHVLSDFHRNLQQIDGRYQVSLPWIEGQAAKLVNNQGIAEARLRHLSRRLSRDPELCSKYNTVFSEMENSQVIEEVPNIDDSTGPVFYMPHRPVVREGSVSTKVRPVFDASAKGYNGVSLNDCMEVGPCLLSNLIEILIRFRRWQVALTADVEKAFLQIAVEPRDRDVHRFLWEVDGKVRKMRFRRVPFGNRCSPFLLNATVRHHLTTVPQTRTVDELRDNMYVDDFLSGCDSVQEGCLIIKEAKEIMAKACMNLTKWGSNCVEVAQALPCEFQDKKVSEDENRKVLGIQWSAEQDCFTFGGVVLPESVRLTKRIVLSYFSHLFDPLGFVAPFIMQAKIMFQELWCLGLDWDDELPGEHQTRFLRWLDDLDVLRLWQIPRSYTGSPWCEVQEVELHAFGDASPKGYGACVYMKAVREDGSCSSSLVMAKSKVAPLKVVTLPRLELLACLLAARLLVFVRQAFKLATESPVRCWTDSMIALSWIQSNPAKWKTFVSNRVTEIQGLIPPDKWSHCQGDVNPADLLTRGVSAETLVNSQLWLQGPDVMLEFPSQEVPSCHDVSLTLVSHEIHDIPQDPSVKTGEPILPVERWGTLTKALRVIGYMCRFLHNARCKVAGSSRQVGDLSFVELETAKKKLVLWVQKQEFAQEFQALSQGQQVAKSSPLAKLTPYLAEDGCIRMKGRIEFSHLSFDEKHPIILPKCHLSVLLVRFHHVLLKHAGVGTMVSSIRSQYWIIGVRRIAKRVKKQCIACQRIDALACAQPMAPLPDVRVQPAVPFEVTGLDHAGPLYCGDAPHQKFWVLLFTCAVTRAVHLELVNSLSTVETVLAIRRLAARRGMPRIFYSDNAKGFRASPAELEKHFGPQAPQWRFIAPLSPWWGGWWERLIRSVKSSLKKTVGNNSLTRSELETTLHEIEACINSRPLTFVSDVAGEDAPLTPAHFLLGHGRGFYSTGSQEVDVSSKNLGLRYELRKALIDKFWSVWSCDYIRNLPALSGSKSRGQVNVGDLVLVADERLPRLKWPVGVITSLLTGRDGVVRTVKVRTPTGEYVRSVPRVHHLELAQTDLGDPLTAVRKTTDSPVKEQSCAPTPISEPTATVPYVTRRGRIVKPVNRL